MSDSYIENQAKRVAWNIGDPRVCDARVRAKREKNPAPQNPHPQIELTRRQKKLLDQIEREKPPAPTIVSKATLGNLAYLQRRGKIPTPFLSPEDAERHDAQRHDAQRHDARSHDANPNHPTSK